MTFKMAAIMTTANTFCSATNAWTIPMSLDRSFDRFSATCIIACDREESALAPVAAVDLELT